MRVESVVKLLRAIRRERPLRTLRARALVGFPWEIGYLRYLWLTHNGRKRPLAFATPDSGTQELGYSKSYFAHYRPDRRVQMPVFLLASIPDCPRDSLLVLGPRYEPEILMAKGLGWDMTGVRGLDTFSYSPYIDVGDMHALPYADERFSAIICGWTLSYSTRPEVAAREMQRVLRPGGYLVVAMQKTGPGYTEVLPGVLQGEERIQTLNQLDRLYDGLERVAGFEPMPSGDDHGHTLAAYLKPHV